MAEKDSVKAQKMREDVRRWDDANKRNNAHYHEMTNFIMGQQWEDQEAKLFEDYKKMPLTANKLAPMMNHMLGEQRQNTPNLQIEPAEDVEEQAAEVREALIKEITFSSDATAIYQTAFEQAVIGGFGAYCIVPEYDGNDSFDQLPRLMAFKDPTKCFWDLGAEHYCKVDGMYSGFRTTMSRRKFRSIWGKEVERDIGDSSTDVTDTDNITTTFSDEQSITVINMFERQSKKSVLYQLSNGESISKADLKKLEKVKMGNTKFYIFDGEPVTVVKERDITDDTIIWSKWGGDYRLEETTFPTKIMLPMIYVDQKSYWDKNGKQVNRSFFKDAKDTQRFINYLRTQIAYLIKVSRYDQFLVSKKNVAGADTQAMWRDPSTQQGGLWYDESPNGNVPIQLRPPELSASLGMQYESATQDLQMTTGMYDTMMGNQGNEISGDAVDSRIKAGSLNTFLPRSSLDRAITCGGAIINEMIPNLFDTQRKMKLNLKSRGNASVELNKPMDDYGMQVQNDMTKGKFKIRLIAGQSYEGQKTEDRESMDLVLSKNPGMFSLIADLYVESLPMSNNIEMRNRLRTVVPPEIIQAGKTGEPIPPKTPQQDPMVVLKQQELQMKMQNSMMEHQAKAHELQLQEQKMMMESHQAGVDFTKEIQKIQIQQKEIEAQIVDQKMRFEAEMANIMHQAHMNHTQNVVKILTHQPNHFKVKEGKSNGSESAEQ